ncbi:MAG TPA: TetR/AcrR family transcriptional regulator [Fibrobacteraceae bacterium]|nr:TetR/AcrR family transcriptional regulator [Fibrobacteraceae bacterium]
MDNKTRLLQESTRLFASKGVDAVGIREIVAACSITKPTLYHYFGSKEGLLKAVLAQGFLHLNAVLDGQEPYRHDLPGFLGEMAEIWMTCVHAQPDFFRVEIQLVFMPIAHPGHQLVRGGHEALQRRMEKVFITVSQDHGNMRGRHRSLAAGWLGTLHHWTALDLGGWVGPGEQFIQKGLRQFLYGVFS